MYKCTAQSKLCVIVVGKREIRVPLHSLVVSY